MLATMKEVFAASPQGAVAAFNVFGYEDAAMVVAAAEEAERPVFLMANKVAVKYMGQEMFFAITSTLAKNAKVPVAIHLDHSDSFEAIKQAVDIGYTSVMFDGSDLPVEENIKITRQVVQYAKQRGVSVEAEIGHVSYSDNVHDKNVYTTPEDAAMFAASTGVDALAVSIGTVHRSVKQGAKLDFELLGQIRKATSIPLVIHGSTGVLDNDLQKLSKSGVKKINIGTALRQAFGESLRGEIIARPEVFDRTELFRVPMKAVKVKATEKIRLLK